MDLRSRSPLPRAHARPLARGAGIAIVPLLLACGDAAGPGREGERPGENLAPPAGQIAFVAGTPGTTPPTTDLYLVNADGSGLAQLTNTPLLGEVAPQWSRDGRRLAYSVLGGGRYDINVDGSDPQPLPPRPVGVLSPDGQRLAYSRSVTAADGLRAATLFVANGDGSGAVPVAAAPPSPCASPCPTIDDIDWSPDGRRLVYRQSVTGTGGSRYGDLFVASADGSSGAVALTTGGALESWPRWSPDGSRVAFVMSCGCITGAATEIHVINADGTGGTQLTSRATNGTLSHAYLSWSPDGRWLATARTGPGAGDGRALYAISTEVPDAEPRRVAALPGAVFETAWRPAVAAP